MKKVRDGALGMAAEILFVGGLILLGFAVSMICGW